MDKRKILVILALFLIMESCLASEITRSLSSATVAPGEDLTVTLTVTVDGDETFYAIDELVPTGWTVKDAGSGSAEHEGHIKWVIIESAENTSYTYTLTAPIGEGTTTIVGMYQFEGMAAEADITGTTSVSVAEANQPPVTPPAQTAPDYTLPAIALAIAAVVIVAFVVYSKRK